LKTKGIYFLYRVLQAFGLPVLLLYFLHRGLRNRAYWNSCAQRLGFLPRSLRQTGPGAIWLHAVSVGEILSSIEFLKRLRREYPRTRLLVSTSTLAGRALAAERLSGLTDGTFYAPVDYVWAVRRVLRTLKPSLVLIAETEIWPNLFRETKRIGAGLAIVNGRISDRAFPRYRRLAWFFREVLPAADCILTQTDSIRDRFLALGAPPERTRTAGNFKHDFEALPAPPDSPVVALLARVRPERVWIAASTMPPVAPDDVDEDDAVLAAFPQLASKYPALLLILVPRKPERFDAAAKKLAASGIRYLRRSELTATATLPLPGVLLLDSIGELGGLFGAADVVFMGGTLARRGGHNILEPAFFSRPVIVGSHMENFQSIADEFRDAHASVEISSAGELAAAVDRLLASPEITREIGRRAMACAEASRGASDRALAVARDLYSSHLPWYRPSMPWFLLAWALSQVWIWGARRRQARGIANRRELDVTVISVGNLTMGGTGKTPCVLRLASELKLRGHQPGILTRGYGRVSPERQLIVPPGGNMRAERTGDEPQLFIRSGLAPVGIGEDRFEAGAVLHRQFGVDVLLLDDGFQHVQLARTVDVVLIDALDPFAGGCVFPIGRLREPLTGLARADVILITRSDFTHLDAPIQHQIRQWNPDAPVFRASLKPQAWIEHRNGRRHSVDAPPFQRAAAFCGLGNPESFRRTLQQLGIPLADWLEFSDHHRYGPLEVQRISWQAQANGADALVTTQKDAVNLCEESDDLAAPLPLYWLDVTLAVEREADLLGEIERRVTGVRKRTMRP
jgi:3-deoxy-D-manno-octulosonic-acid transferase